MHRFAAIWLADYQLVEWVELTKCIFAYTNAKMQNKKETVTTATSYTHKKDPNQFNKFKYEDH